MQEKFPKLDTLQFYYNGVFYPDSIREAARFILEELAEKRRVRFSEYYDGQDEKYELLQKMIITHVDTDMLPPLIDVAVVQLQELGIVRTATLPGLLFDDTNDYEISLVTDIKGKTREGLDSQSASQFRYENNPKG